MKTSVKVIGIGYAGSHMLGRMRLSSGIPFNQHHIRDVLDHGPSAPLREFGDATKMMVLNRFADVSDWVMRDAEKLENPLRYYWEQPGLVAFELDAPPSQAGELTQSRYEREAEPIKRWITWDPSFGLNLALHADHFYEKASRDLLIMLCGMGGQSGVELAPIVAQLGRATGNLTVAVLTFPFASEGKQRTLQAEAGLRQIEEHVDAYWTLEQDSIFTLAGKSITADTALRISDDLIAAFALSLVDISTTARSVPRQNKATSGTETRPRRRPPPLLGLASIAGLLEDAGLLSFGIGYGRGPNRAEEAALAALANPLFDRSELQQPQLIIHITHPEGVPVEELLAVEQVIHQSFETLGRTKVATTIDPNSNDFISVRLIAAAN